MEDFRRSKVLLLFPIIFFIVLSVAMVFLVHSCVITSRHYDDALVVEAIITDIRSYSDNGESRYVTVASYEVDGKSYKADYGTHKSYFSASDKMGDVVNIEVSPDDPSTKMNYSAGVAAIIFGCVWCVCIAVFLRYNRIGKLTNSYDGPIPMETAMRDLKIMVRSRTMKEAFLLGSILIVALRLAFPRLVGWGFYIPAAIFFAVWVYSTWKINRYLRSITEETIRLEYCALEYTKEVSEGHYLYYGNERVKWCVKKDGSAYRKNEEGTGALAVYHNRKLRLYYDQTGRASASGFCNVNRNGVWYRRTLDY